MRRFLVAAVTLVLVVTMASPATAAKIPEPPAVCDPDPYPMITSVALSTSTLDLDHHHTMTVIVSAVDGESPIQSVEAVFVLPTQDLDRQRRVGRAHLGHDCGRDVEGPCGIAALL